MQTATAKRTPTLWRDIRRDWRRWNPWERRAAAVLGLATAVSAAIFALTLAR